jgi:ribonuclease HII
LAPSDALEREAGALDGQIVFGVDEVGRGPLAGPVTAAAAWIDLARLPDIARAAIGDSKALTAVRRIQALELCAPYARTYVAWATVEEIDSLNILQASLLAMTRAVRGLVEDMGHPADFVLVDGNRMPKWPHLARTVVKGDAISLSIALASIAAKQARDAEMTRLATLHPGYGWERNAGYGTAQHLAGIRSLGVTPEHRRSFAPVRSALEEPAKE